MCKQEQPLPPLKQISYLLIKDFKTRYTNFDLTKFQVVKPAALASVNITEKRMAKLNLSEITIAVVCGTLFGDASIDRSSAQPRIQFNHSTRQKDWFFWKCFCGLQGFIQESSITFRLPDGKQTRSERLPAEIFGKLHVATLRKPEMTELLDIVAPTQKKMERSWLNHMNAYFLMVLWLDDGSLSSYSREGVFCFNSMPYDQLIIFANYLETVWGIKCGVRSVPSKKTGTNPDPYEVFIRDEDNLEKFLRIIAPLVPVESMIYKVCFCPIDSSRQQRWASELKRLVNEKWHDTIDTYILYQNAARAKTLTEKKSSEEDIVQEN